MKEIMEWVKDILLAVVIAAVILAFFKPIIVQQQSMEPNFHAGDYLITSRQAYRLFGDPQRGDVIVFKSELLDENEKPKNLIKRIIALPGETIEIKGGEVYMGDNREYSEDSRSPRVGTIEQSTIVGKVIVRLYPFNSIKTFKGVDYES